MLALLPLRVWWRCPVVTLTLTDRTGNDIEEIDDSRLDGILRAHYHEPIVLDQLLENIRPVPQMIRGSANVDPHRFPGESAEVVLQFGPEQAFDGRTDPIHDRANVLRLILGWLLELLQRGGDRPALRVSEHHD